MQATQTVGMHYIATWGHPNSGVVQAHFRPLLDFLDPFPASVSLCLCLCLLVCPLLILLSVFRMSLPWIVAFLVRSIKLGLSFGCFKDSLFMSYLCLLYVFMWHFLVYLH